MCHHRKQASISAKPISNRKQRSKSQYSSHDSLSHMNSLRRESPSRFRSVLSKQNYKENSEKTGTEQLIPSNEGLKALPSGYKKESKAYNCTQSRLLHEAKMFQDSDFQYLWNVQKKLQPFVETVAGRLSFLRSLNKTFN